MLLYKSSLIRCLRTSSTCLMICCAVRQSVLLLVIPSAVMGIRESLAISSGSVLLFACCAAISVTLFMVARLRHSRMLRTKECEMDGSNPNPSVTTSSTRLGFLDLSGMITNQT